MLTTHKKFTSNLPQHIRSDKEEDAMGCLMKIRRTGLRRMGRGGAGDDDEKDGPRQVTTTRSTVRRGDDDEEDGPERWTMRRRMVWGRG